MEQQATITLFTWVQQSNRRFSNQQLMTLGQLFSEAYKDKYGVSPSKIEQREGNRMVRVNAYPEEFLEDLNRIAEEKFPRPKPRSYDEGRPKRKRKRVTRKPVQIRPKR